MKTLGRSVLDVLVLVLGFVVFALALHDNTPLGYLRAIMLFVWLCWMELLTIRGRKPRNITVTNFISRSKDVS
jgi:hypothetical protein